jgi:hypothetical protein
MSDELQDQVLKEIMSTGESLKKGLWSGDDLATLRAISADVATLEGKALAALHGLPAAAELTVSPGDIEGVIRGVPADPALAGMYRKAADRALDSAANLALIRMQAVAGQVDALRRSFTTRLWNAIAGLLPGLSAAAPADDKK